MSNSYRKNPIFGITVAESEKEDKQRYNRKMRRVNKHNLQAIDNDDDLEIYYPLTKRDIVNVWMLDKDGKHYWSEATKRDMLK